MSTNTQNFYKCPVCQEALLLEARSFRCAHGHSYDIAKEGYVNLLLANQKASKDPGDDKEMLLARRQFLEAGHYDPLIAKLTEAMRPQASTGTLLDIGCGEGYYTQQLAAALPWKVVYGFDISKPAMQLAAKRYPQIHWAIASAARLPYLDESISSALSIFAPYHLDEVSRVLQPGGSLWVVGPGPQHLQELASLVYTDFQPHTASLETIASLQLSPSTQLTYQITPSPTDIINVWKMSPYYWHSREGLQAEVASLQTLTIDFRITRYQK